MDVRWITAFVDRPGADFEATARFWSAISGSSLSPWRGDNGEFATLLPDDGAAPHLKIQRTNSLQSGSHIDLHVSDVERGADECLRFGARPLGGHDGYVILASPGGMAFCVVAHDSGPVRQGPVVIGASGTTTLVDQVSVDIDPGGLDEEVKFWSAVTGWSPLGARSPEFVPLDRPPAMPLRVMFQRRTRALGATSCHLDLACEDVPAAVSDHQAIGATVIATHRYWTVMADPAGAEYCLTSRQPSTGMLPAVTP